MTILVLDRLDVMEAQRALVANLDAAGRRRARCRATDVERTHRQLRARLTDRLRGDHADRLADVDEAATRQIAAVAVRAHTVARRAGDRRAHLDLIDAFLLEPHHFSSSNVPAGTSILVLAGQLHVFGGRDAAEHAIAQPSTTSPPSTSGVIVRPWSVPQSTSVMTRSCATSTRRRVR
jgi:hypothetical protein